MLRRTRVLAACALIALVVSPVASTFGQGTGAVTADKEGWWSQTGRTTPAALPTTVPEGAIAVGAAGGQPYAVAALGIVLDAPRGSSASVFTLTLTEAEGTGAQQNPDGAVITACPVTSFFAGDHNGAWEDAPAADCEAASAEGVRNEDGTWTFDLLPLANAWLDPFGTVSANGIRFDPGDSNFLVSFTGMEDAVFDVSITPAEEESDPFDSATTTVAGGFTGGSSSSSGSSSGGSVTVAPPPAVDVPTGDGAAAGETTTTTAATGDGEAEQAAAPSRAGDVSGNLPGALLLLAAAAVLTALVVGVALGPLGRTRPGSAARRGGVSRALEARTQTGASS